MVQYHKSQLIIYICNILVELQGFLTFITKINLIIYMVRIGYLTYIFIISIEYRSSYILNIKMLLKNLYIVGGDSILLIDNSAVPKIDTTVSLISPRLEMVMWSFKESSSFILYSLNVAIFGPMFMQITKSLWVVFKCFFSILALSVNN